MPPLESAKEEVKPELEKTITETVKLNLRK